MRALYTGYCSNHPSAVNILTEHRYATAICPKFICNNFTGSYKILLTLSIYLPHSEELGDFMESRGASSPGILTLTTGLSKPFMRLDKYPTLLKELERHMEVRK